MCRLQVASGHAGTAFRVPGAGDDESLFPGTLLQFNIPGKDCRHPQFLQVITGTGNNTIRHFAIPFHPGTDIGISPLFVRFGIGGNLEMTAPADTFHKRNRIRMEKQCQLFHPGPGLCGKSGKVIFRHTPGVVQSRNFHIFIKKLFPGRFSGNSKLIEPRSQRLFRHKIGSLALLLEEGFTVLRTCYNISRILPDLPPGNKRQTGVGKTDMGFGIIQRIFFKPHIFDFQTNLAGVTISQAAVNDDVFQRGSGLHSAGFMELELAQGNACGSPLFRGSKAVKTGIVCGIKAYPDITLFAAGKNLAPVIKTDPHLRIERHIIQPKRHGDRGGRGRIFRRKNTVNLCADRLL